MNSHELANLLLTLPPQNVTASVDLSTGDADAGNRAFGELYGLQPEPDDSVTLLFECGRLNFTKRAITEDL